MRHDCTTKQSFCVITPHEKQHNALHKAAYIQIVVITYNKASWYSLHLSHIICELVYYIKYYLT